MIPTNDITAWAHGAPWPTPDQVEQDLLLSQLICLIAHDDTLGDGLVFRGGTCLHKLYLSNRHLLVTGISCAPLSKAVAEAGRQIVARALAADPEPRTAENLPGDF